MNKCCFSELCPQSFGSHVRFSKYKANEPFDLSFQFSTFDMDGQVLYWTSKSKKNLIPKSGKKNRNGKKRPARGTTDSRRRKSRKEKSGDERLLIEMVGKDLGKSFKNIVP